MEHKTQAEDGPCCNSFVVEGPKLFDPRDGTYKVSSNPALVMAHLVKTGLIISDLELKEGSKFWDFTIAMANYCDEEVPEEPLKDKIKREVGYNLDENTEGFFSITITKDPELKKYVPTITLIAGDGLNENLMEFISRRMHSVGKLICGGYNAVAARKKEIPFCDGCHYLDSTEEEQEAEQAQHRLRDPKNCVPREPHRCLLTQTKLLHGIYHPKLPRPQNCPGYVSSVREGDVARRLDAMLQKAYGRPTL